MKNEKLLNAIGNINDDIIHAAAPGMRSVEKRSWAKWGVLAACMCLIAITVLYFGKQADQPGPVIENNNNQNNNSNPDTDKIIPTESSQSDTNEIVTTEPSQPATANNNDALFIPAIELPEIKSQEGIAVEMDMIGLIVYQGRIYTQAEGFYDSDNKRTAIAEMLLGERLGTAKGNISEWSTQDDYATEFASTAQGDVYTVNGYSPEFRLATKWTDGNTTTNISFFENLNGIYLNIGKDLFGDRLNLSENWESAESQSHESWNYVLGEFRELSGVTEQDLTAFLEILYASKFINTYETEPDIYGKSEVDPKSAEIEAASSSSQKHLYFHMNDGTTVELRLKEGGYVGYQHLGWYFVKMPGEAFDRVFDACK